MGVQISAKTTNDFGTFCPFTGVGEPGRETDYTPSAENVRPRTLYLCTLACYLVLETLA